jgi:hypothetical protein
VIFPRPLKKRPTIVPKTSVTTNLRRVKCQKSRDLIYTGTEAWNHPFENCSRRRSRGNQKQSPWAPRQASRWHTNRSMPSAKKLVWRYWKRYPAAACTSLFGLGLRSFQCISFKRPWHELQRTAPFWKPPICSDRLPKKEARHAAWQCIISHGSHWQFHTVLLGLKGVGPSFMPKKLPSCDFHLKSADFWVLMRHVVVKLYRHFGTTYRSHLQGSRNTKWISWTLRMEPTDCPETLFP